MRIVAAVLASLALAAPVLADVIVVDGDTLKVDGVTYRLWGIDAPEHGQFCVDGLPAGVMASEVLRNLVAGKVVACQAQSSDRDGQILGVCRADGLDLAALMVRSGWAWAFVRYSSDYVQLETEARAGRVGVHDHNCQLPWDWRRKRGMGDSSDFPKDTSCWRFEPDVCCGYCGPAWAHVGPSEPPF